LERIMTKRIPKTIESLPLHPERSYRVESDTAIAVTGFGPSSRQRAIDDGLLPPPVKIGKRARAWLGSQLIELQRRRLAEAEAEAAAAAARRQKTT
jgi:predicted DNA-binding transcriptional regulator AlpA